MTTTKDFNFYWINRLIPSSVTMMPSKRRGSKIKMKIICFDDNLFLLYMIRYYPMKIKIIPPTIKDLNLALHGFT